MRVGITRDDFFDKLRANGFKQNDPMEEEYVNPIDGPKALIDRISLDGWFSVEQLEAIIKTMKDLT